MHTALESTFTSFDKTQLFFRAWLPEQAANKAIIMFHRGHEHSGRLAHLVEELKLPDFAFFAWDQRGHGNSPGERGYAPHLFDFVRDIDSFVQHIVNEYSIPIENIVVIGHSVSAVLVSLWVKNYAPRIRAMVLGTPAFKVKLYVPFALPGLRALLAGRKLLNKPLPFVKSYVKGKLLTHDPEQARSYDADPLISKQIAVNILLDLASASRELVADAGAIVTPTLLLSARADWVVKNQPQRDFFQRLSSPLKRVQVFRGMYHAIFHEKDREPVMSAVRDFVQEAFSRPVDRSELTRANKSGFTYEEYQWLNAGLPMISCKRLSYKLQALSMKTLGRLSEGVKLGWTTGFDSGESLDYVYKNTPSGSGPLGRQIDKTYLNSVGWVGIRVRKVHLERLLRQAMGTCAGNPIRIVDIAGGPGLYVLDSIRELKPERYDVLIRDWSETGLEQGRKNAQAYKLDTVRYERGDAFDAESLRAIEPKADIAIVSGLYELFPDNQKVANSLAGLRDLVKPGGYLLYTNQPWHPQIEMIAEVLVNREQKPWIMRRRTQAEMDELVRQAGFNKLSMELDNFGIFTVSLAQRHDG